MRTFWFIVKVVAAVLLAASTVIGLAGTLFDTRDTLDMVAIWGWTWFKLLFAVMCISFWVVVISLYITIRKHESKQPNLALLPIAYSGDNVAYLEVYNSGGYAPNCIANVKSLSVATIRGNRVSLEYLSNQSAMLLWDNAERTMNIPNDGVRRRLVLAELFSGGWKFPKRAENYYSTGWYQINVVLSFESETTYTKTASIALGCEYIGGKGKLNIHFWEHWLENVKQVTMEANADG